ncbi:hypothetical protein M426DRAFT_78887 [Hypoxylon sp. CI-4A]|nr:hypothetical protein M426DRAFT_78887 [Hypoxylon sp. CI-4A]
MMNFLKTKLVPSLPTFHLFEKRETKVFSGVSKTKIEDAAHDFDQDVVEFTKTHRQPGDAKNISDPGPEKTLKIGLRIIRKHALIIIQELNNTREPTAENRIIIPKKFSKGKNAILKVSSDPSLGVVRQIHIRYEEQKMVLAYDTKREGEEIHCDRYTELCEVYTTWKQLQYFGLISCHPDHSIVASDCATFARMFINNLFACFVDPSVVSQSDIDAREKKLKKLFVIVDESASIEAESRGTGEFSVR